MNLRKSALVDHPAEALFDLIEAAEHYPAFLPWCAGAQIVSRDEATVAADITVAFAGARFTFRTRNPKQRPHFMAIHLERGPFRDFEGEWRLAALGDAACRIDFALRYEFDSALVGKLAGRVFDRIADSLVDAFVRRADALRGGATDLTG
jgi:ribosome-associated toxin RatA of RatAB toxin-antitoxin module